jgi:hypothetical protein
VTPAVTGDGLLSLRGLSSSSDLAAFSSTEGTAGRAPQLVLTLAASETSTSTGGVFRDGFETGDLSRWLDYEGLTVQSGDPYSGAWSARAKSTGQPTYAFKNLSVSEKELFCRMRFKLHSIPSSTNVTLLRFLTGSGLGLARLHVTSTGKLVTSNSISDTAKTSVASLPTETWQTVQVRIVADGTASRLEVWLNDVKIDALTQTSSLGTTPIGRLQLGHEGTGKTYDVSYDDLLFDTKPLTASAPPQAPTGLNATASRIGEVALSWRPATDDIGVTGYEIYRDGTLLAAVGAVTSFTDTTVSPSTPYEYSVRAKDAEGNASPLSSPASVTTLGPDTTPPSAPANLSAVAVSSDRVDLSWQASTDDVGVTGYRIYRDGALIDTIDGGTPRYSDLAAGPAQS